MGKKENNGSDREQKAVKAEQPKSAEIKKKPGRELNEPVYDVKLTDGEVDDVFSEEADYPTELYEFLCELLTGLHDSLNLADDEEIPPEVLNSFFEHLLEGSDIKKIIHETNSENLFGIAKPTESAKTFKSADEEEDVDSDEEKIPEMDWTLLPLEDDGTRIFMTEPIEEGEEDDIEGILDYPISITCMESAIKYHVIYIAEIPFLTRVPTKELNARIEKGEFPVGSKFIVGDDGYLYNVTDPVFARVQKLVALCSGNEDPIHISGESDMQAALEELKASSEVHENGYDEEMMEYWYNGKIYHEKDVVWFEIPLTRTLAGDMKGFFTNLDAFDDIYTPIDISKARLNQYDENGFRILSDLEKNTIKYYGRKEEFFTQPLPSERVWVLAMEQAKKETNVGIPVVCLNGRFYVPVEPFINYRTCEIDNLVIPFNAVVCPVTHHKCSGLLQTDIGNLTFFTAIRYCKGHIIDWQKRLDQEVKIRQRFDSGYNPYDDPYDNPGFYTEGDED